MDWHPIQGGVEILLVASCYRNRDMLRPDGPLGSHADFTIACTIELWMHAGGLLSTQKARVALGYRLVRLLRFFRA